MMSDPHQEEIMRIFKGTDGEGSGGVDGASSS
jgi:hypothetical protein